MGSKVFDCDPLGLAIAKKNGHTGVEGEFFSHFYATVDSPRLTVPADAKYGSVAKELENSSAYRDIIDRTEFNHILSSKATLSIFNEMEQAGNPDDPSKQRQAINAALGKASEEYDKDNNTFIAVAGGAGLGHESAQNDEQVYEYLEVAKRLQGQEYFKTFIKMVGRLRTLATDKMKNKKVYEGVELHGITLGNNLEKVMPEELANLFHPILRKDFLIRYAEGRLMQFEFATQVDSSDGPIIVLGDESASMSDRRRAMMYSILAGTISLAKLDQREVVYLSFADICLAPVIFKPSDSEVATALKMAKIMVSFQKKGTCYSNALMGAHALVNGTYKSSDIIMLSDGQYAHDDKLPTESASKKLAEIKARIFGILINSEQEYADHLKKDLGFAKVTLLSSDKEDFSEAELRDIGDKIYSSLCEKKG